MRLGHSYLNDFVHFIDKKLNYGFSIQISKANVIRKMIK